MQFKEKKRLPALKKSTDKPIGGTTDGSAEQNKIYCSKLESRIKGPFSNGRLSKSGDRTDLDCLGDDVIDGRTKKIYQIIRKWKIT